MIPVANEAQEWEALERLSDEADVAFALARELQTQYDARLRALLMRDPPDFRICGDRVTLQQHGRVVCWTRDKDDGPWRVMTYKKAGDK